MASASAKKKQKVMHQASAGETGGTPMSRKQRALAKMGLTFSTHAPPAAATASGNGSGDTAAARAGPSPDRPAAACVGGKEYLVKWKGLGYEHCTWESISDLELKFGQELAAFRDRQQPIKVGRRRGERTEAGMVRHGIIINVASLCKSAKRRFDAPRPRPRAADRRPRESSGGWLPRPLQSAKPPRRRARRRPARQRRRLPGAKAPGGQGDSTHLLCRSLGRVHGCE